MNKTKFGFAGGLLGAAALAFSSFAVAAPTEPTTYDNTWTFTGTGSEGGTTITGEVYWSIVRDTSGTDDQSYFVFSIKNTSPTPNTGSKITSFAWDFPADVTPDTDNTFSSIGWKFGFGDQKLPGGKDFDNFGGCTFADTNCTSNAGVGVMSQANWFYVGLLPLNPAVTTQQFADVRACLRFGTVGADGEDSGVACRGGSTEVPEPGSLALLGLGLVGIGLARRRKAVA